MSTATLQIIGTGSKVFSNYRGSTCVGFYEAGVHDVVSRFLNVWFVINVFSKL